MTNMQPYEYAGALAVLLALYLATLAIVAYGGTALSARLLAGI